MKNKRILSFVLALLMVSVLLPLSVFAQPEAEEISAENAELPQEAPAEEAHTEKAEKKPSEAPAEKGTYISFASATVNVPVIGGHPIYTVTVPSGAHYTADVWSWQKGNNASCSGGGEFEYIGSGDIFEDYYDYRVCVEFIPDDGYYFNENTYSEINGRPEHSESFYAVDETYNSILYFKSYMGTNLDAPVVGGNPDFNAAPYFDHDDLPYTANVYKWYVGDTWDDHTEIDSDYVICGDETYWVWIEYFPRDGCSVEGENAFGWIYWENAHFGMGEDYTEGCTWDGSYNAVFRIEPMMPEEITEVYADDVTEPAAGAHPDYSDPTVPYNASYYADILGWYVGDTFDERVKIYEDDTFELGQTYWVWVEFWPDDGYTMSDNTTAYINGNPTGPDSYYSADGSYNGIMSFTVSEEEITTVYANNVTEPVAGDGPIYNYPSVPDGAPYYAELYDWYVGDTWFDSISMDENETFEPGQTYWVLVEFWPDSGYTFSDNTVAYINGNPAGPDSYYYGGCYNGIMSFTLPEEETEITEVYADVTVPAAGAHPDFNDPAVPSGAHYSADIYHWYVGDTWNDHVRIDPDYTFEAGETYWVWVEFRPDDGYTMSDDTVAYINGIQAMHPYPYGQDCYDAVISFTIPEENEGLLGDYDCNGIVDITDAVLTLQAAMNLITPSGQALANADIDGDGVLTVSDAIYIMGLALGI